MTVQVQRFCPLCDRSFVEGEAVLRCGGCGVMHHPGCWVTNNGCATPSEHHVTPIAQAYSGGGRPPGQAPHPGEGTRVRLQNSPRPEAPIPAFEPLRRQELPPKAEPAPQPPGGDQDDEPVIGGEPWPPMARSAGQREPRASAAPPTPPRRYQPAAGDRHAHPRPMPRIYQKRPITSYWYIPAAIAVAIVVAFGVIWAADRIFGGGGDKQPESSTPAAASTAAGAATQPPGTAPAQATASATTSPAAGSGSSTKFAAGEVALVTGTGECLNVRVAPGTSNDAIVCLKDGEEVTVSGGPEESGDLQWWKVKTRLGEGWAAEDYLVKK